MTTSKSEKTLRIGLWIESGCQPQWIYQIVEEIQQSSVAQIQLVMRESFLQKGIKLGSAVWTLYEFMDRHLLKSGPDAFDQKDLAPLVKNVPSIQLAQIPDKSPDMYEADFHLIKESNLDVIFHFTRHPVWAKFLSLAKYGVWVFRHSDPEAFPDDPPGFWEVIQKQPTTSMALCQLTENGFEGNVLCQSWSRTFIYSVYRNKAAYFANSSHLAMKALNELFIHPDAFLQKAATRQVSLGSSRDQMTAIPNNLTMVLLWIRMVLRVLGKVLYNSIWRGQFFIAYQLADQDQWPGAFSEFKELVPPKDRFWADPFPVFDAGRYFIFLEEFPFKTKKGYLSVMEMDSQGTWGKPVKVLEKEYHLSYPYIFNFGGTYYMIPESSANKTIDLYRCTSFPFKWEFERTLLDRIEGTDTTLMEKEGRWWLFTSVPLDDELRIFYSDNPLSGWKPHAQNPVKSDVRSSRPAGHFYSRDGQWYRPAQNGSRRYAYGISINRLLLLTETEFEEKEVRKILPDWDKSVTRTHTLNHVGKLTVIDAYKTRWKWGS